MRENGRTAHCAIALSEKIVLKCLLKYLLKYKEYTTDTYASNGEAKRAAESEISVRLDQPVADHQQGPRIWEFQKPLEPQISTYA